MKILLVIWRVAYISFFILLPAIMFSFKLPFYKPDYFAFPVFKAFLVPTLVVFLFMYILYKGIGRAIIVVPFILAFLLWLFSLSLHGEEQIIIAILKPLLIASFIYSVEFLINKALVLKKSATEEVEENKLKI